MHATLFSRLPLRLVDSKESMDEAPLLLHITPYSSGAPIPNDLHLSMVNSLIAEGEDRYYALLPRWPSIMKRIRPLPSAFPFLYPLTFCHDSVMIALI